MAPLSISQAASQALQVAWRRRRRVARAVMVPALGQIIVGVVSGRLGVEHLRYQIPLALVQLVLLTMIAVAVHRILLLEQDSASASSGLLTWTPREIGYFSQLLTTLLIVIVVSRLTVRTLEYGVENGMPDPWELISTFSEPFFAIVSIYIVCRLSLVLPATAIDEHRNFSWAWKCSRGQGWRLLAIVGLFPGGFLWWARTYIEHGQPMLVNALIYTVWVALFVTAIAMLSSAYQTLAPGADR
ncbi:MAG: hypothetical protein ACYC9L_06495 [Sulfuricaulis sp.]